MVNISVQVSVRPVEKKPADSPDSDEKNHTPNKGKSLNFNKGLERSVKME